MAAKGSSTGITELSRTSLYPLLHKDVIFLGHENTRCPDTSFYRPGGPSPEGHQGDSGREDTDRSSADLRSRSSKSECHGI